MFQSKAVLSLTIIALAGSFANAQTIDWIAPVSRKWNDPTNSMGGNVPNAIGEDAIPGFFGSYADTLDTSPSIRSLHIFHPATTFFLYTGRALSFAGPLTNSGIIEINPTGESSDARLFFAEDTIINGTGVINLGRSAGCSTLESL